MCVCVCVCVCLSVCSLYKSTVFVRLAPNLVLSILRVLARVWSGCRSRDALRLDANCGYARTTGAKPRCRVAQATLGYKLVKTEIMKDFFCSNCQVPFNVTSLRSQQVRNRVRVGFKNLKPVYSEFSKRYLDLLEN